MPKRATFMPLAGIELKRSATDSLHHQLYEQLRVAILTRRLVAGTRLPSTRALAATLAVSRNTVVNAFDQLLAEGYLEGHVGRGTYVARALPDESLQVHGKAALFASPRRAHALSRRGSALATIEVSTWPDVGTPCAFRTGVPALDLFPMQLWTRLAKECWRDLPREHLAYGEPAGYPPLREAIAAYLGASRGVRCITDQVIVVSGSQQALELAARLLLDPGDRVWLEDPGYRGARGAIAAAGARLVPVPVDSEGIQIAAGISKAAHPKMVYVTPSHQSPLGVTMSLRRRLALLDWARRTGVWILEDDFDSEYRYVGRPLPALQGLDDARRVIYVGTFSKVLFPALRLGYMVVPMGLMETFTKARALIDRQPPILEQVVLARFILQDHFARHLRRMRVLYAERQSALVNALERELGDWFEITSPEAGLQLVAWLPIGVNDRQVSERAAAYKVEAAPLSAYTLSRLPRGGLALGYAAFSVPQIREGVRRLKLALRSFK